MCTICIIYLTLLQTLIYNNQQRYLVRMIAENQACFKKKHTLQQRIQKSKKQMAANPGKIVIIVEKHPKSILPTLSNPRFLCQKDYKFSMIKSMLEKKIRESGKIQQKEKQGFYIYINGNIPNAESTMIQLYDKYKDEDGFLYMQYQDQATY